MPWFFILVSYTALRCETRDGFGVRSGEEPERSSTVSTMSNIYYGYILKRLISVSKYHFSVPKLHGIYFLLWIYF